MNWLTDNPPFGKLCLVKTFEYGQNVSYALARPWQSSGANQPVKWILDKKSYHLDRDYFIAEPVIGFIEVTK